MRFAAAQGKEKWRDRGLAALFVTGFWIILAVCFDFYYDLNDDTAMKDILSGTYTGVPDGHNIQSLYPLGWCVSMCYRILPVVPWHGVFLCGCQFFALWIIVYSLCGHMKERRKQAAAMFFLTAGLGVLFLYEFVFVQYTVTAGLLACSALVRLYTGPDADVTAFGKYHIITVVMIGLAFFLRTEMLLLLCPFLGLTLLFRAQREWQPARRGDVDDESLRKKRADLCKNYGLLIGVAVIVMGLGLVSDSAAYGSEDWKRFRQFFDDRTQVYDFYGIPPYEDNQEFYDSIGLSEAQYTLLENYNFDLDEEINEETMHEIAVYAAAHQDKSMARRLYESVYAYVYRFAHGEELIFDLIAVFSYFFLVRAAVRGKDTALFGKLALLFGVRTVLWLFLLYRNRAPQRVTHPLYLAEFTILGLLLLFDADVLQWKNFQKSAILSMYAILFVCTAFSHIQAVGESYRNREAVNVQWQMWKEYCRENPEHFYYLDVYSSVAYSEKLFSDTSPAYRNFDLPGGWCVKSPLALQKRRAAGFESAAEGILAGKAFFAADNTKEERSPDFLVSFFREKGTEVRMRETDRCGDFSVFGIQ